MFCAGRLEAAPDGGRKAPVFAAPPWTQTRQELTMHQTPRTCRGLAGVPCSVSRVVSVAKCWSGLRENGEFVVMIYGDRKGEQILNFIFYSDFLVLHVDKTGRHQNWRREQQITANRWNILQIPSMAPVVAARVNQRHKPKLQT